MFSPEGFDEPLSATASAAATPRTESLAGGASSAAGLSPQRSGMSMAALTARPPPLDLGIPGLLPPPHLEAGVEGSLGTQGSGSLPRSLSAIGASFLSTIAGGGPPGFLGGPGGAPGSLPLGGGLYRSSECWVAGGGLAVGLRLAGTPGAAVTGSRKLEAGSPQLALTVGCPLPRYPPQRATCEPRAASREWAPSLGWPAQARTLPCTASAAMAPACRAWAARRCRRRRRTRRGSWAPTQVRGGGGAGC